MVKTRITFADELKLNAIEIWNNILSHKFINEISMDTLPSNKFVFYLRQDNIFLKVFCNVLQNANEKCELDKDNRMKEWFGDLYDSTINLEMEMQNQLLDSLGMTSLLPAYTNNYSLESNPSKMTLDYTSYLIHVSLKGGLHEIVSAMAPCPWSYFEIAKKLSERKQYIKTEVFRKWIDFYSSYESVKQVEDVKDILNELSRNAGEIDKKLMINHFNTASKYEYNFWEMAYSLDSNSGLKDRTRPVA
jgi:thiaminase (transcriptional activator TenA)